MHGLEVLGNVEGSFGLALNFVNSDAVGDLDKGKTLGKVNVEDSLELYQRECALLDNLGVALLVCVLHCHNDLGLAGVADKIHSTTEALDLSGKHPVGQVTIGADLHGSQDGKVDATAADHAKALLAAEDGGTRLESDSLLTSVDQISVLLTLLGVGSKAKNTVLRLELDLNLGADEARCEHGHTNTQVGVHAVLELLRSAADNALTLGSCVARAQSLCGLGIAGVLGKGVLLDRLLLGALNDTLDVDAGQMDSLRGDLTGLDDVLGLDNGHLCVAAHGTVEVVCSKTELAVAKLVGLVGLDEGVVTVNALLKKVRLALEDLDVLGLRVDIRRTVGLVAERELAGLDNSTKGSGGSSLRGQLELDLTSEVHLLKGLVLANVTSNHLADLLGLEKSAETEVIRTGVVRDSRETGDVGLLEDLVDQGVGDTTETEATAEESRVGLHVLESLFGRREDLVNLGATGSR
ncbi:hypothetical protein HG531_006084 [Fusarium graminearum]|nr:hypothetical protein HG531_006084 [Fusarium graminearum]